MIIEKYEEMILRSTDDMECIELVGQNFKGLIIKDEKFPLINISKSSFYKTMLDGVEFESEIQGLRNNALVIENACNAKWAEFVSSKFENCKFIGTDFSIAKFKKVEFIKCDFMMCSFISAELEYVNASGCDFLKCDFRNAKMMHCDLLGSNVKEAIFEDAHFMDTKLNLWGNSVALNTVK